MKKARFFVILLLIVAIVIGLLGWWFMSLGKITTTAQPVLRLAIEQGVVYVKTKNSSLEEKAKSGMELSEGDVVHTGEGARASIMALGRSDLRLSENTEIEIDDVNLNWAQDYVFRFRLKSGRAWSRVLKLLDLGSTFEGQTDNVVATVRGTAFAMEETGDETQLFVDHSAVVTPLHGSTMGENIFAMGEWGSFDFEGRVMLRGHISSSTWPNLDWIDEERMADARFVESARKALLTSLAGNKGVAIDDWKYGMSRMSEGWHLRFSGDSCKEMTLQYLGRRLYQIYDLMDRGKSGLAFQHLADLEKEINSENNDSCAEKIDYTEPVGRMLLALSTVSPEDKFYKLKLKFEELYIGLYPNNSAEAYWARGLALDARLEELERFGCRPDFREPMDRALGAVEQGLARQDRDFESLPKDLDENISIQLSNKTHVQHIRLEKFLERLQECEFEDMNPIMDDEIATSTTSTDMEAPTSTNDTSNLIDTNPIDNNQPDLTPEPEPVVTPEPMPEPQPQPEPIVTQPTALDLQRIQLFAQPNPVNVGGVSSFYVKGYKKDGTEMDVTGNASFEQIGSLGTLSGSRFQANRVGSVTIIARVFDNGQEFTSQVSLRIIEPLSLDYLEVSGNGSAQVYQGDTRQLSVIAHYTNGEIKTVTSASSYSVSNSQVGTMSGSLFRAGFNGTGWVSVTAQYTEEGVTKQGEVSFEVIPDTGYTVTP
jgi:hypothetical protein